MTNSIFNPPVTEELDAYIRYFLGPTCSLLLTIRRSPELASFVAHENPFVINRFIPLRGQIISYLQYRISRLEERLEIGSGDTQLDYITQLLETYGK
jgi:hypothetical protein